MNEKVSISDIQRIMGTSYPTALKFATAHGELYDGRWFVPLDEVTKEVDRLTAPAIAMVERMEAYKMVMEPTP